MALKKIKSPLGPLSHPFKVHDGIFSDIEEAKFAIRGVLRAYFGDPGDNEDDYLFFKSGVVRFEDKPELDLELDHRKRTVVFVIQEPKGKNARILKNQIRNQIIMQFAVLASDSRGRTAMTIYRSLEPEGRDAILETERQKEKKQGHAG